MERSAENTTTRGLLPPIIMSIHDIGVIRREIEALDEFLRQSEIRKPGESLQLPRTNRLVEELAQVNNLNLLKSRDRAQLVQFLDSLQDHAPVVHISFAADPSSAFLVKIVSWFRRNIHPLTLVQVGLQPNIAAGCTVRTANKTFDFSLRKRFFERQQLLVDKLNEVAARER